MTQLIGKGVEVDIKDGDGCTLLHWAAEEGHKETVEELLKRHAKLNVSDDFLAYR